MTKRLSPSEPGENEPAAFPRTVRVLAAVAGAGALALAAWAVMRLSEEFVPLPAVTPSYEPHVAAVNLAAPSVAFGPIVAVVLLAFGVITWGWPRLLSLPHIASARATMLLVAVCGALCALCGQPIHVAYAAALAIPAVYVAQMLRRDGRAALASQVSGTYTGALVGLCGCLWIVTARAPGGGELLLIGAAVIAAGSIPLFLVPSPWRYASVLLCAAAGGMAATYAMPGVSWWPCIILTVGYTVLCWGLSQVIRLLETAGRGWPAVTFVLLPHSALGVLGYASALLVL